MAAEEVRRVGGGVTDRADALEGRSRETVEGGGDMVGALRADGNARAESVLTGVEVGGDSVRAGAVAKGPGEKAPDVVGARVSERPRGGGEAT